MSAEITVVLTGFRRPAYLRRQLEALRAQSLRPAEILLWNTDPGPGFERVELEGVRTVRCEHDFKLPGRFAFALLARTSHVCIMDDDIVPGPNWLRSCLDTLERTGCAVGSYGIIYGEGCDDETATKFGDHGVKVPEAKLVDMIGHSWFFKKEWIRHFWAEDPVDWSSGDDLHFSYTLQRYGGIGSVIPPHPENDQSVWSNLCPDLGLDENALFRRDYHNFIRDRANIVREYVRRGWRLLIDEKADVTASISTRGRYETTLPLAIASVAQQTRPPKALFIFDDGAKEDLRKRSVYSNLFNYLERRGIAWRVFFGRGEGQVHNHNKAIELAETSWIWRLDDDNYAEATVLEKLMLNAHRDVGAIGGLVLDPHFVDRLPLDVTTNLIKDVRTMPNIQWFLHEGLKEVEHLYSTFVFRREAGRGCYDLECSPACHREETIFSYRMKRAGWRLLVDPSAVTWHFRDGVGGIRSFDDKSFWDRDEVRFDAHMREWGF